jgi:hypothetical protein
MDHSTTPVPSPVDAAVPTRGLPVPSKPLGECVLFKGDKLNGYGVVLSLGKIYCAHRIAWSRVHGPIPPGLVVDHLCRNKLCVNVDHLDLVTEQTNILRGRSQSAINARKTKCKRGHPLDGDNLRINSKGARQCRTCDKKREMASQERKATRARANKEKP